MVLTNLPDAILIQCISFIGTGNFLFVAGVCRSFRTIYTTFLEQQDPPKPKTTTMTETVSSIPRLQLVMNERHIKIQGSWRSNEVDFITAVLGCAIFNGNLDVLVRVMTKTVRAWIRLHRHIHFCNVAAKGGQLKVLQWLRSEAGGKFRWDSDTCKIAAENGHLDVLKYAHQNGCPWNKYTCAYAASKGRLEVLKWARQNGCKWDAEIYANAAENGHLEVLKWAHQNGCPWNTWTCSRAAANGHFEVLKWLHQNECPWDHNTYYYAKINGHLEIGEWAKANGCSISRN